MTSSYIVNGAGNGTYPRLEIANLMQDEYQFSLFMQAMSRIQSQDYQPKPASWQEIGGIHGLPYTRWSGDPQGPDDDQDPQGWGGYCYHASVLFPPWHRVLLLLVEQAVCTEARNIVSAIGQNSNVGADEQAQWNDAATKLRFPYWDWSATSVQTTGLPAIFETPSVDVRGPGGTKITLDNPIRTYNFNPIPDGATNEDIAGMQVNFQDWTRTYRWATNQGDQTDDNVQELNKALEDGVDIQDVDFTSDAKIRQKLGRIFSFPQSAPQELWSTYWDYFSNTSPQSAAPPDAATIAPIEEPHNWVHLTIGGDGDMAFNDLAGFDPIFYFHHCNVDRLYALWEYVYPDYWLGQGYYDDSGNLVQYVDPAGTYQEVAGTPLTESSPLAPFRKSDSEYWTSADVRGLQPGQGRNKCA
ncbi:hypothetical protein NM688_g3683 [Phlebia brevispora]|uniref:Uncharacterized protein n=1 Tax=Phlebia brevispora TaxID=194682 RepID=A0ACC1T5A6_9APHY|nr:hypothetical protein NM688_g3683 [Phlebia brevispora]